MNELDHCYLEALSEALKGNLGEALELRNEADALASEGFSFSENYGNKYPFIEEAVNTLLGSFDFTRCVRADGSAYGTRGKCKKGTEQAKQPEEKKAIAQRGGGKVTTPSMVKAKVNLTVDSIVKEIRKDELWPSELTKWERQGIAKEVVEALKDFDIQKRGLPSVSKLKESYWLRQTDDDNVFRGAIPGVDTED